MIKGKHVKPSPITGQHKIAIVSIIGALALSFMTFAVPSQAATVQELASRSGLSCNMTDKANGGFVLDCNPPEVSPSPSASGSSPTTTPAPSTSPSASPTVTPSPSPSSTSPSPSPSNRNNCVPDPLSCGFPDVGTTGSQTILTVLNGNRSFSTPNSTITDTQINGCVEVRAANIKFVNVKFNGVGCFYAVRNFSTGLVIEDSDITCGGANGTGVTSNNYTLRRVEIYQCENGLNVSGNVTLEDSLIRNGVTANGAHTDGAQFNQGASNITFRHNTILMPSPGGTSAIIMWDEANPQNSNVLITNNLLAGGTYTLYCPRQGPVTNIVITNNRFGYFQYGHSNGCVGNHITTWSGNVDDASGAPYFDN